MTTLSPARAWTIRPDQPGDEIAPAALFGAALDDLWTHGAETARVATIPGSPEDGLLRGAGFAGAPGAFDFGLSRAILPSAWSRYRTRRRGCRQGRF